MPGRRPSVGSPRVAVAGSPCVPDCAAAASGWLWRCGAARPPSASAAPPAGRRLRLGFGTGLEFGSFGKRRLYCLCRETKLCLSVVLRPGAGRISMVQRCSFWRFDCRQIWR